MIVGSYVPDGVAVGRLGAAAPRAASTAFYDIDTPGHARPSSRAATSSTSPPDLIPGYDLYLSFTGGPTLDDASSARFGSPAARALYCSVDPDAYPPLDAPQRWDLGYLGTYSADRQPSWSACSSSRRGGARICASSSPARTTRTTSTGRRNVERLEHVPPGEHPRLLRRWPLHAERHARRHGPGRLQPERPPVRGRRLRRPDHLRPGPASTTCSSRIARSRSPKRRTMSWTFCAAGMTGVVATWPRPPGTEDAGRAHCGAPSGATRKRSASGASQRAGALARGRGSRTPLTAR